MDRFGKKKSMDFYEGETITVRLKGEDIYREFQIKKLYPETGTILTQLGPIQIEDIERLRTFRTKKFSKYFSYMLWIFGASWGGYSLIAFLAFGEPLTWSILWVMGVSFLIGWILRMILRRKTYKVGKKRKLRIIDMTIEPFRPKP